MVSPSEGKEYVYPVREDTFLLLEAARKEIHPTDRVLEVGAGSGYIVEQIQGDCRSILATDINPHAVRMVREKGIDVLRTDLIAGICGRFDLVLFNPPYLPTRPDERIDDWLEYALDGGLSGREVIVRFAAQVERLLAPEGRILLLVSSLTGPEEVKRIFDGKGMDGQVISETFLEGERLLVYRFWRKTTVPET
jgi:release factor glutamine methyltransferase